MSHFDLALTLFWTATSTLFCCLAIYGIRISRREYLDNKVEFAYQESRKIRNGVYVLASQQLEQAKHHYKMHRYALLHQTIGLLVGLLSFYFYFIVGDTNVDTPTTDTGPVQELFVPILFEGLLVVVSAVQARLILVTRGERGARKRLKDLEKLENFAAKRGHPAVDAQAQGGSDRGGGDSGERGQ